MAWRAFALRWGAGGLKPTSMASIAVAADPHNFSQVKRGCWDTSCVFTSILIYIYIFFLIDYWRADGEPMVLSITDMNSLQLWCSWWWGRDNCAANASHCHWRNLTDGGPLGHPGGRSQSDGVLLSSCAPVFFSLAVISLHISVVWTLQ